MIDWLLKSSPPNVIACDMDDRVNCATTPNVPDWQIAIAAKGLARTKGCGCLAGVIAHELGHAAAGMWEEHHPIQKEWSTCICSQGAP
jgi:Zn-dependent protease with chaperone function